MNSAEASLGGTVFDPLDPRIIEDPYPSYAELRRRPPTYLPDHDLWLVSRYADVVSVMRQPELFSSRLGMADDLDRSRTRTGVSYRIGTAGVRVLIATDPPDHQKIRRLVAPAFSPAAIRRLLPEIELIAASLLDQMVEHAGDGIVDFFTHVAEPLPVLVLARLFGVPTEMHDEFRHWSRLVTSDLDQTEAAGSAGRGIEMLRYFKKEIDKRRGGDKDLLAMLSAPSDAMLSEREMLAFCVFLLVAGMETTTNLATNLIAALVRNPAEMARIRSDPTHLVPTAVEEGLRYDTSVQALWRATTARAEVGGTPLPKEARLLVMFGAANRDERQFPDADSFVADREDNRHLGFGDGPHYCLGGHLARAELAAMLRALIRRTSAIEQGGDWVRVPSVVLRGHLRQPIRIRPC